jgi:hypothetical protein
VITPAGQAQIAAGKARHRETWDGERPLAARLHADVSLVETGWSCWSSKRRRADDSFEGRQRGGVVLEIRELADGDTGEIFLRFRTRDPFRPAVVEWLGADEIQVPDGVERPDRRRLWLMVCALGRSALVGEWPTATGLAAWADANRLLAILR